MSDNVLLRALLAVSQKAASIAKMCRENDHLLSFLVREKKESERNPRFLHDFKTLVDVLVQEVIKHDLCQRFSMLEGQVFGEESNEFSTDEGNVIIEIKPTLEETTNLLLQVLKDEEASQLLASLAYETIDVDCSCDENLDAIIPPNIGVWIDPIDSTGEYIQGKKGDECSPVKSGLPCVTVLIGVFDRDTGCPIIGVVNQPFAVNLNGIWSGQTVYGYHIGDHKGISQDYSNIPCNKIVAVSTSEDAHIKEALQRHGYTTVELAGAGYKLLNIITGIVSAYVLSKPTTFFWDTCAGNAILNGNGGGLVDFKTLESIKYQGNIGLQNCCNTGGIFAFRNSEIKDGIIEALDLKPIQKL